MSQKTEGYFYGINGQDQMSAYRDAVSLKEIEDTADAARARAERDRPTFLDTDATVQVYHFKIEIKEIKPQTKKPSILDPGYRCNGSMSAKPSACGCGDCG